MVHSASFGLISVFFGTLLALGGYFSLTGNAIFFHTIPQGYAGVYQRFGAILQSISPPGLHFMNPITTSVYFVQTTIQTDTVSNVPCGTSGGVMIYFDKIEVVNRLRMDHVASTVIQYGIDYDQIWIFDKIHHEINQFCSKNSMREVYITKFDTLDESLQAALQFDIDKYDTGIEIIAIRVTKPRIPDDIRRSYEEVEKEKTRLLVLQQKQILAQTEAETERIKERIQAQKVAEVAAIHAEQIANISRIKQMQMTDEKRGEAERQLLENELHIKKQAAITTADYERQIQQARAQALQLTPEYLTLKYMEYVASALGHQNLIYFGKELPNVFLNLFPHPSQIVQNITSTFPKSMMPNPDIYGATNEETD